MSPARLTVLLAVALAIVRAAHGQAPPAGRRPERAGGPDVALFRVEPLGLDPERAARLEALFRLELERLLGAPLPSRARVERLVAAEPALRGCTGEPECLAAIGKKLGARRIVSGNVGELGDSYVVNLKIIDVESKAETAKIAEPLRGSPDELIEAMRVAAYRLVAPERLRGQVAILADVGGGNVFVDGRRVGRLPLANPIADLTVGKHHFRIVLDGYTDFLGEVEVRFQKTTQVVVRMVRAPTGAVLRIGREAAAPRWYASTWGYVAIGVTAVAIGTLVGYLLAPQADVLDCTQPGSSGCVP